jgi:peptide/nickel transport system substrate-binding protein
MLPPGGPDLELGLRVKQDWEARGYGTALVYPLRWTFLEAQKRRDPAPADLADVRVRQALIQGLDRGELVRALFGELGIVADSWIQPDSPQYRALGRQLTRYSHDPQRAATLLREAGWERGPDGIMAKGGARFAVSVRGDENIVAIIADQWKSIGVDPRQDNLPPQLERDRAARASFTGFDVNTGPTSLLNAMTKFSGDYIPGPENQWTGLNRGGYANPAWDDLARSIFVTIDEARRLEAERQLVQIFSTDLPALPLYFGLETVPVGGGLTGIQPITGNPHTGTILHTWNVHEWDVRPSAP